MPQIHVIIPCFNEAPTLSRCVERILNVEWPRTWTAAICIVNDHSTDETGPIAEKLSKQDDSIKLIQHDRNQGKGAAVHTGLDHVLPGAEADELVVIQDADLEYDPSDLIEAIVRFETSDLDAIVGDRFKAWTHPSNMGHLHMLVNRFLTNTSNALTGLSLADMECCYKIMRVRLARRILPALTEKRFGIEPQLAAALARQDAAVGNMPVSYSPRTAKERRSVSGMA